MTAPDLETFDQLVHTHDGYLRAVARRTVRSGDACDDVMQIAYEKVYRSIDHFDGRSSVRSWLHSVVHRTAIDYLRRERRRQHEPLHTTAGLPERQDPTLAHVLGRAELEDLLGHIAPRQRAALLLTAGLGFTHAESASIVGVRRGTIGSWVCRTRETMHRWEESDPYP
jgi:RNA polymerase sigma-70 factor (ECF subfamily)